MQLFGHPPLQILWHIILDTKATVSWLADYPIHSSYTMTCDWEKPRKNVDWGKGLSVWRREEPISNNKILQFFKIKNFKYISQLQVTPSFIIMSIDSKMIPNRRKKNWNKNHRVIIVNDIVRKENRTKTIAGTNHRCGWQSQSLLPSVLHHKQGPCQHLQHLWQQIAYQLKVNQKNRNCWVNL